MASATLGQESLHRGEAHQGTSWNFPERRQEARQNNGELRGWLARWCVLGSGPLSSSGREPPEAENGGKVKQKFGGADVWPSTHSLQGQNAQAPWHVVALQDVLSSCLEEQSSSTQRRSCLVRDELVTFLPWTG